MPDIELHQPRRRLRLRLPRSRRGRVPVRGARAGGRRRARRPLAPAWGARSSFASSRAGPSSPGRPCSSRAYARSSATPRRRYVGVDTTTANFTSPVVHGSRRRVASAGARPAAGILSPTSAAARPTRATSSRATRRCRRSRWAISSPCSTWAPTAPACRATSSTGRGRRRSSSTEAWRARRHAPRDVRGPRGHAALARGDRQVRGGVTVLAALCAAATCALQRPDRGDPRAHRARLSPSRPDDAPIPVYVNEAPVAPYREVAQIRVRATGESANAADGHRLGRAGRPRGWRRRHHRRRAPALPLGAGCRSPATSGRASTPSGGSTPG